MNRHALAGTILIAWLPLAVSADDPYPSPPKIADLGWLAGCWSSKDGEKEILEQWMRPGGDTLLGMSRTAEGSRTREHEFMRIVVDGETLAFVAHPSGQAQASFRLRSSGPREVVFENLEHDFPQRIGYRSESVDRLSAWIEGRRGERERRVDFTYRRTACE